MLQLFAICVVDTGGKFSAGVVDTGDNFLTPAVLVAAFAAGVIDTGGKFAAGVNDTGGKLPPVSLIPAVHLDLQISPRI